MTAEKRTRRKYTEDFKRDVVALGIALTIESQRANNEEPRILIDDSVLPEGLPRTEDIEQRLGDRFPTAKEREEIIRRLYSPEP